MRRHFLAIGLVAAVAGSGLVLVLDRGGFWQGRERHEATAELVWCLCAAAALAGAVGARAGHRALATAAAGIGLLPAAVLAVVLGQDRDHPANEAPVSVGQYGGFAALGVLLGLAIVWTLLTVPGLGGSVLAWYGWVAALLAAVALGVPEPVLLILGLAVPAVLSGVLGFAVARAGRSVAVATAAGLSVPVIFAAGRLPVAGYWVSWTQQYAPCRVASGECDSTYLLYELFLIPALLAVLAAVAMAGAWLGQWRQRAPMPGAAGVAGDHAA
jgi:hypothetical protein